MRRWRILVASDDPEAREPLAAGLLSKDYLVETASSASDALDLVRRRDYTIALVDFAGACGFEALAQIQRLRPQCFLIALTAPGWSEPSLSANPVYDLEFAIKPCRTDDIVLRIARMIQIRDLQGENAVLRQQLARQLEPGDGRAAAIFAGMSLSEMEKVLIRATIQHTGGNIKEAASVLEIDRSTLYEKIKRYGIPRD